jgi:hypothetical protein
MVDDLKDDSKFMVGVQFSSMLMPWLGVRFGVRLRVRFTIANSAWLLMFMQFKKLEPPS